MKTINKKATNVLECKCGTVLEYGKDDLMLDAVAETDYYAISVECPNCHEKHIAKPNDKDDVRLIASVKGDSDLGELDFDKMSFSDIKAFCDSDGLVEKFFKVGMTKSFELKDGSKVAIEVAGINHDRREDGTIAPATFIFKDLFGTNENGGHVMNSECTNAGGWEKSEMRKYLNEDFIKLLPDELVACIQPVVKMTANKGVKGKVVASVDKIFIPSEVEVLGKTEYSYTGEGEQYEIFKEWRNRLKGYADGEYGRWWWLRSPYSGSTNYFCYVSSNGSADLSSAYISYGVSPCFAF